MWLGCFERNLEENAVPANLATVTAGSYPSKWAAGLLPARRAATHPPSLTQLQLADVKSATAKL